MGLVLTKVGNKIQYLASNVVSDPDAERYAKDAEAQAAHDAEVKAAKEAEQAKAAKAEADKKAADEAAEALATRSRFSVKKLGSDISKGILQAVLILSIICFAVYGGSLAANQAIGYNAPFRLLSFFYGMIFSFFIVPKALYDIYWAKKTIPYYSVVPLSTYAPSSDLEKIFIGAFCYTENESVILARAAVINSYMNAFNKSISVTPAAVAAVAAVGSLKLGETSPESKPATPPCGPKPSPPESKPITPPPAPISPPAAKPITTPAVKPITPPAANPPTPKSPPLPPAPPSSPLVSTSARVLIPPVAPRRQ